MGIAGPFTALLAPCQRRWAQARQSSNARSSLNVKLGRCQPGSALSGHLATLFVEQNLLAQSAESRIQPQAAAGSAH
jgi:hypothetical protein